jgi:hypothetical protein
LYRENSVTKLSRTSQGETSGSAATVGDFFAQHDAYSFVQFYLN